MEEIHFEIGVNIGKKYIFLHTRMRNDPIFKEIYPTLEKRYLFWTPPLSIFTSARVCSASHNQVHIKYLRFGPGRDEEFLPGRDDTPSCTFVSARAETKIFPGRVDTAGPRWRYTGANTGLTGGAYIFLANRNQSIHQKQEVKDYWQ